MDPVVAQLDKPLTRLPELTSPAAVAQNPFGEAFKSSNPKLSVDDFELLKVVGKGSFVRRTGNRKETAGAVCMREMPVRAAHRFLCACVFVWVVRLCRAK